MDQKIYAKKDSSRSSSKTFTVKVSTATGKGVYVLCEHTDFINDIRDVICKEFDVPEENLTLLGKDSKLYQQGVSWKTLGITEGSELKVWIKLKGGALKRARTTTTYQVKVTMDKKLIGQQAIFKEGAHAEL